MFGLRTAIALIALAAVSVVGSASTSAPTSLVALVPLVAAGPDSDCLVVSATMIHDGDTIRCADGRRVRLIGMDTPELDQGAIGRITRDTLRALIPPGTHVRLEFDVDRTDRYGRTLAYVWVGGRMLNEVMIQKGLALVLTYPPNVRYVERFTKAQAEARRARRGLWAIDAFSCTPRDHRARRC